MLPSELAEGSETGSSYGTSDRPTRGARYLLPTLAIFFAAFTALLLRAPSVGFFLWSDDHGHQLSLGRQVVLGKTPFVDLFFTYGPLTAYASAFAIRVHDTLVSEVVVCALGYAAALTIIFMLVRDRSGRLVAVLASVLGFFLLARFYKWYYWLWPLVLVFTLTRALGSRERSRTRWMVAAGLAGGVGSLFRLDLGLMAAAVLGFTAVLLFPDSPSLRARARLLLVAEAALAVPLLLWFGFLFLQAGLDGIVLYLSATFQGATGHVVYWSLPMPKLSWPNPFMQDNGGAAAFVVVPAIHVCCLLTGAWLWRHRGRREDGAFLLLVGTTGIALLPQALHRADAAHLLQVLPPAIVGAGSLWGALWGEARGSARWFWSGAAGALAFVVAGASWNLWPAGGRDLAPLSEAHPKRLSALEQGFRGVERDQMAELVDAIRRETAPGDPILIIPSASQLLYFADRPLSGHFIGYAKGKLDSAPWRRRDLDQVRESPPALVVAHRGFTKRRADRGFWERQPELAAFLRARYRRRVYDRNRWVLLRP